MAIVWEFFQPLLFGLIGAEVNIEYMDSALIGNANKRFPFSALLIPKLHQVTLFCPPYSYP